jgi:hypothetical protein
MIHSVKKTLAVLLLVFFVISFTVTAVCAQQQVFSPAPDRSKSGHDSGYQKGYCDGFAIGYRCLIPSIHYPTPPYDQVCVGSDTGFNNGFKAGYRA